MNINDAYAQNKTQESGRNIVKALEIAYKGLDFCLLAFQFNTQSPSGYIPKEEKKGMIRALRETADRLEKNQDVIEKGSEG